MLAPMDTDESVAPRPPPREWVEALERARADVAAGRVVVLDLDRLCQEIEIEAAALERQEPSTPSAA